MSEYPLTTPPLAPVAAAGQRQAARERQVPSWQETGVVTQPSGHSEEFRTGAWVVGASAALTILAGLTAVTGLLGWALGVALALATGFLVEDRGRRRLVLTLVPATLLTASALVPAQGRYLPPFVVIVALAVASRVYVGEVITRAAGMPRWALWAFVGYIGWMGVATLTSIDKPVSLVYLIGSTGVLGITLFVIPTLPRTPLIRELIATLVISALFIVVSGLLLALVGSVSLYGKSLGLYFFEEFTIGGRLTGIVVPQDYGPYVGPETTPVALGILGAIYLSTTSLRRARFGWLAVGVVLVYGLVSTFSREGWLIAAIACLAVALVGRRERRMKAWSMATGIVMVALFSAGITNTLGVVGRMDLSSRWYGSNSAAVLLNPNVDQRGQAPGKATGTNSSTSQSSAVSPQSVPLSERIALCTRQYASLPSLYSVPRNANAPGAKAPWRDTCNDPPGWQPQWGAPPVNWTAPGAATSAVQLKGSSSLVERLKLWEAAAKATARSPAVGYGPATDAVAIAPYLGGDAGLIGATTHSTFFRVSVEMGLPGLLAYLAIVVVSVWVSVTLLRRSERSPELILAASILAISAAEVTDTLLFGGVSFPGFWLALCVGLLLPSLRPSVSPHTDGHILTKS